MARPPAETLEFLRAEPGAVVERMAAMGADRRGWINLRPQVHGDDDEQDDPGRTPVQPVGFFGLFSAAGPAVPLCTWTPGEARRRGVEPASVGVQHAAGPKVVRRLVELGAPALPEGWVVGQDHPRRGLVVHPPPDAGPEAVLGWLLAVGDALCVPPVTGWWRAAVHL